MHVRTRLKPMAMRRDGRSLRFERLAKRGKRRVQRCRVDRSAASDETRFVQRANLVKDDQPGFTIESDGSTSPHE